MTRGFRPVYQESGLEFVTLRREKNDFIVMERERECFSTAQIFIFSSKAPTAKGETPPLHLSPTRKDRLKIYNTQGMCEERSAFQDHISNCDSLKCVTELPLRGVSHVLWCRAPDERTHHHEFPFVPQ